MFPILLLAQAISIPPIETTDKPVVQTREVITAKLELPDEFAAAIIPYIDCLSSSRGVEMRTAQGVMKPLLPKGGDCKPYRDQAIKDADAMLDRQGIGRRKRAALIETTLSSVDVFEAKDASDSANVGTIDAQNQ